MSLDHIVSREVQTSPFSISPTSHFYFPLKIGTAELELEKAQRTKAKSSPKTLSSQQAPLGRCLGRKKNEKGSTEHSYSACGNMGPRNKALRHFHVGDTTQSEFAKSWASAHRSQMAKT